MRLAIFGATGGTGRCLVDQALGQGHKVAAFVRNPSALTNRHEKLSIVQGDVLDPAKVAVGVSDAEAVLCALGAQNGPGTTLLSDATRNIIAAMKRYGVRRLICQTT